MISLKLDLTEGSVGSATGVSVSYYFGRFQPTNEKFFFFFKKKIEIKYISSEHARW